jgi:hypothetical protein
MSAPVFKVGDRVRALPAVNGDFIRHGDTGKVTRETMVHGRYLVWWDNPKDGIQSVYGWPVWGEEIELVDRPGDTPTSDNAPTIAEIAVRIAAGMIGAANWDEHGPCISEQALAREACDYAESLHAELVKRGHVEGRGHG